MRRTLRPTEKQSRATRVSPADVFHAIADPTRRQLLDMLGDGPCTVIRMAAGFSMSRPAVSQHLAVLRNAGLVALRREGREHHYRLRARRLREVHKWVSHYERFWREKLTALGEYLDRTKKNESAKDGPKQPPRRHS